MILQLHQGNSFDLQIVGYQFPGETEEFYDANWLNVKIAVRSEFSNWKSVDPCMLTYELLWLIEWFEAIEQKQYPDEPCDFMEPNLTFDCVATDFGPTIRVYFRLEARPKDHPSKDRCSDEVFVDFPISDLEVSEVITDLRKYAETYPQRGAR